MYSSSQSIKRMYSHHIGDCQVIYKSCFSIHWTTVASRPQRCIGKSLITIRAQYSSWAHVVKHAGCQRGWGVGLKATIIFKGYWGLNLTPKSRRRVKSLCSPATFHCEPSSPLHRPNKGRLTCKKSHLRFPSFSGPTTSRLGGFGRVLEETCKVWDTYSNPFRNGAPPTC